MVVSENKCKFQEVGDFNKDCFFKGWIGEIRQYCHVNICGVDVWFNSS